MDTVLVTGCSGYIGSHLCKMLEGKYKVFGLDIKEPQTKLDHFSKQDINRPMQTFMKMGAVPEEIVFDAVIHLAALVNVSESERIPIQYYITNLNGTMNVINRINTNNFIFASTGAAELCQSAYGISKRAAEDVVTEYCTRHKLQDYSIFRFYNVIGSAGFSPTNPDGLMFNLMKSAQTKEFTIFGNDYNTVDGTCVRDYVHVEEICDALITAIKKPANGIECLGHGQGRSVLQMFELFKKVNGIDDIELKFGPRRAGDASHSVLENVSPYMNELYAFQDLLRVNAVKEELIKL